MNKFKNWIFDLLKGIGIGLACIIPGVSGGTVALVTKIYDKMVNAISSLFRSFVKSFLILLPIGIGIIIGVVAGFFGVKLAFTYILFSIVSLFAGLILGSIPSISLEVRNERIKAPYIVTFTIALLLVVGIALLSFYFQTQGYVGVTSELLNPKVYMYFVMIPIGILSSFALVAPGISGSMLLMVIGFYQPLLELLSSLKNTNDQFGQHLGLIGCFILGIVVGFFLVARLVKYLLNKHRVITFYGILGFVVGSLPAIFLNLDIWEGYATSNTTSYAGVINNPIELALGIPLFFVGAIASYLLLRLANKKNNEVTNKEIDNA